MVDVVILSLRVAVSCESLGAGWGNFLLFLLYVNTCRGGGCISRETKLQLFTVRSLHINPVSSYLLRTVFSLVQSGDKKQAKV